MGKHSAGAGFGISAVCGAVIVIPGDAVVTRLFGRERGLCESGGGTAALMPDRLSIPTPFTLHPAGMACRAHFWLRARGIRSATPEDALNYGFSVGVGAMTGLIDGDV